MAKDEIKRALEVCTDCYSTCKDCPYDGVWDCGDTLKFGVLGFIIEQEGEIERLKADNQELATALKQSEDNYNRAFERLKTQQKEIEFQVQDRARLQREIEELEQEYEQRVEEIGWLKAEVNKGCNNCETVKQAQIDALKRLRSRIADKESLIQSYIVDGCLTIEDMYTEIEELIKELKDENKHIL